MLDTVFNIYLNGVFHGWAMSINHCHDIGLDLGYLVSEIACVMETAL